MRNRLLVLRIPGPRRGGARAHAPPPPLDAGDSQARSAETLSSDARFSQWSGGSARRRATRGSTRAIARRLSCSLPRSLDSPRRRAAYETYRGPGRTSSLSRSDPVELDLFLKVQRPSSRRGDNLAPGSRYIMARPTRHRCSKRTGSDISGRVGGGDLVCHADHVGNSGFGTSDPRGRLGDEAAAFSNLQPRRGHRRCRRIRW